MAETVESSASLAAINASSCIPGLTYRTLRPGESGLYRALRFESLKRDPDGFGSTYEEESRVPTLKFEAAIEARTAGRFVIGAFVGERLVGLAGFARQSRSKTTHRGDISQVYVDPAQRGRSIAQGLLRMLLDTAFGSPDLEQVELGVVTTNTAALRLYRKLGFREFGLLENYLKSGDLRRHMFLMQLTRDRYFGLNRPPPTPRNPHA